MNPGTAGVDRLAKWFRIVLASGQRCQGGCEDPCVVWSATRRFLATGRVLWTVMSEGTRLESGGDSHLILEASWIVLGPIWEVEEARHQGDDQELHGCCFLRAAHTAMKVIQGSKQNQTNGGQEQSTINQTKSRPKSAGLAVAAWCKSSRGG